MIVSHKSFFLHSLTLIESQGVLTGLRKADPKRLFVLAGWWRSSSGLNSWELRAGVSSLTSELFRGDRYHCCNHVHPRISAPRRWHPCEQRWTLVATCGVRPQGERAPVNVQGKCGAHLNRRSSEPSKRQGRPLRTKHSRSWGWLRCRRSSHPATSGNLCSKHYRKCGGHRGVGAVMTTFSGGHEG
jgi:hypothetical protein